MLSDRTLSRIGGLAYLGVAVAGGFAEYVRTSQVVQGDPAATARNVADHSQLFGAAFVSDVMCAALWLVAGLALYALLRQVNPRVAVAMLVLNAVSVAIQALNLLNHVGAFLIATDATYTAGLGQRAAQDAVAFLLQLHSQGYIIAQVYFGLFLLPLGYLVYHSGLFPRVLGVILAVGSAGYLAGVVATYLAPGFQSSVAGTFGMVGGVAEIVFLFWLLLVGPREPMPRRQQQVA
jgi:hypothetical protein